eukprot:scaffold2136_cov117-Isochrysis_galbana.AAC.2
MASSSALALPLVPAAAAWAVVVELAAPLVLEPPLEGRNTSERNTVHACMQLVSCNALDVRASAADELVRRRAQPHTQAKHGWAVARRPIPRPALCSLATAASWRLSVPSPCPDGLPGGKGGVSLVASGPTVARGRPSSPTSPTVADVSSSAPLVSPTFTKCSSSATSIDGEPRLPALAATATGAVGAAPAPEPDGPPGGTLVASTRTTPSPDSADIPCRLDADPRAETPGECGGGLLMTPGGSRCGLCIATGLS